MSLINVLWAFIVALAFVVWPTIGKYSGASGEWVATTVLLGSTLIGLAFSYPEMRHQPLPSARAFALITIAALVNGYAVYMYSMKATDPAIDTGTFIAIMTIMMVVLGLVISALLTGQIITFRQWSGIGAAIVAIWLIAL